ncbi:hypothetical protein [Methylobacterium sp. E-046]|uniref:hypothetical protein n=1 Tax=Methylobacterium sp. E-046 TaxID=2836576 RepID=UPI001FBC06C7|nr:hypothetical protein [Methylobacterium sp. E-046]MCJ2098472.1 hypothetical protein [Methylobacterium sp. E-046]
MADTLAAALPREMVRVASLIPFYRQVENGGLAAALMQASIDRAQEAIASGDAVAMLLAHADLQGYEL